MVVKTIYYKDRPIQNIFAAILHFCYIFSSINMTNHSLSSGFDESEFLTFDEHGPALIIPPFDWKIPVT